MDTRTGDQQQPKRKSTHITLPPDLKKEAQIKALREGRSLSEVVEELLAQYVKK